jgi:small subunit ribosomal protein S1
MSDNDAISMQEQNQESNQEPEKEQTMESLMGEYLDSEDFSFQMPVSGEIRDGIIASISGSQILVSVGAKSEGLIVGKEFDAIPQEILETFEVGKAIPVYVVNPHDQEGNLVLSFVRAVEEQSWIDAEAALASGESFESTVVGYNKGGLLVPLSTIRGFIPASQLSLSRRLTLTGDTPEAKYKDFVGESVSVCVIEVDRERHRLILSERAASSETRDQIRDKVMEDLTEGEVRKGRVTSLADFGAFVNIGGADGLVHMSEISWDRVVNPNEVLKVGEEVKVKIISIDRDRRRIGLSIRQLQGDPWSDQVKNLKTGQLVEGEITRLTSFGAFARLNVTGDLEGLIHISELSDRRVDHPKEVIKVGDVVTLRILKIEDEDHRIGLSMRRVDSPAYADSDWKSLAADFDLTPSSEGETLATILGEATPEPVEEVAVAAAETVEEAKEVVEEVVAEAPEAVEETVEEAKEAVEEVVTEAPEVIEETVEEVKEAVEDTVAEATETVEETVEEVQEAVEETVEAVEPEADEEVKED